MQIKTTGTIINYISSPVVGNLLRVSVSKDIADKLDDIKGQVKVTISEIEQDRSNDQNALMWELLSKLHSAGFGDPVELYRRYIREAGLSKHMRLPKDAYHGYVEAWTNMGVGFQVTPPLSTVTWTNGKGEEIELVDFIQYYGTHVYKSGQMSRLIDAIVQDCEAVGIEAKKDVANYMQGLPI